MAEHGAHNPPENERNFVREKTSENWEEKTSENTLRVNCVL